MMARGSSLSMGSHDLEESDSSDTLNMRTSTSRASHHSASLSSQSFPSTGSLHEQSTTTASVGKKEGVGRRGGDVRMRRSSRDSTRATTMTGNHSSTTSLPSLLLKNQSASSNKHTADRPWILTPHRWSLVCLLLLILSVASTCSFIIHLAVYWSTSSSAAFSPTHFLSSSKTNKFLRTGSAMSSLVRSGTSVYAPNVNRNASFAPRVSFLDSEALTAITVSPWKFRTVVSTSDYNHMTFGNVVNGSYFSDNPNSNISVVSNEQVDFSTERSDGCRPMAEWQIQSFPNCNSFHETDWQSSLEAEALSVLGKGWFRITWKLDDAIATLKSKPSSSSAPPAVVLKTLRLEREFLAEYYELHRRDATAMERLTWSEFVVDIYGYCGQSAINEMANFPYGDVRDLEKFNRKLRNRQGPTVDKIKLQMAASVAQGVADIHSIDGDRATMVHYDLNPRNIALFDGGRPKINDFNIAEFLYYNPSNNETCGFENRMHQPWWRAPEEVDENRTVLLNEKVDVYSLCNILFATYTTHAPRGKMKDYRMEGVRQVVLHGIPPELPPPYHEAKTTMSRAFHAAFDRCFPKEPAKRATAQEITDILSQALDDVLKEAKASSSASSSSTTSTTSSNRTKPVSVEEEAAVVAAAAAVSNSSGDDDAEDAGDKGTNPTGTRRGTSH